MSRIFVTGGTGLLGRQLVRTIQKRLPSAVTVLPVRPKRIDGVDYTAEERFDRLFGRLPRTELHTGKGLAGQPDTVVLNAFDVAWHTDVRKTLTENVQPMVEYLDECAQQPTPPNVVIVSSAYVQPPKPYRQLENELMPMGLAASVETWYEGLLNGTLDWASLDTDDAGCHTHTLTNSYILAKTLMEHLVMARYGDSMPITIVRPSNIGPSADGQHGVDGTFGPQLFASILQTPYFRCFIEGGGVDIVPVCGVAETLVDAIQEPRSHRFVHATCGAAEAPSVREFLSNVPVKPVQRVCVPPLLKPMCAAAQWSEARGAAVLVSPNLGNKVQTVFDNYNYWTGHSWTFPASVKSSKIGMMRTLRQAHTGRDAV